MDWIQLFLIPIVKGFIVAFALLGGFAYLTWLERKLCGRFQIRYGPNRAGPFGLLHPIADMIKMFFKEEFVPGHVERAVYVMAPGIGLVAVFSLFSFIPVAPQALTLFGYTITPYIADVNVALILLLGFASLEVYGIVLGGWSSNNKYSLLGALRTTAQMISYELPMGITLVAVVLLAGSLSFNKIVDFQVSHTWLILLQPLGFLIYFITALAEAGRGPFDLPESENELIGGYATEYGGMKFALFFGCEYINMIIIASLTTTLFLGGWHGPFVDQWPFLGLVYFLAKVVVLLCVMVWVRASMPRIRYDHLMNFCWKFLTPLAIINLVVTAIGVALLGF
jgi:NADH-quinone oxidoreductase subunit H